MKQRFLAAAVLVCLILPGDLSALGVYEDYFDRALFLASPRTQSLTAGILRTENGDRDASCFFACADYPLLSFILLRAELSYGVLAEAAKTESGMGDLLLRGRAAVLARSPLHLYATCLLRTGSGSNAVFPYSSGSIDVGAGIGCVDSLSMLTIWGEVTAASVNNKPGGVSEEQHGNYATVALGLVLPATTRAAFHCGGAGYFSWKGGARDVYFAGMEYAHSPAMDFFLSLQAEGGAAGERIFDFGLRSGVRLFY
ncbi:MAG: hypothetical protein HY770_01730 [Chitinivibrionia bacterium]|nr:hypothetical protein [Chitinivibrionia bacterium]